MREKARTIKYRIMFILALVIVAIYENPLSTKAQGLPDEAVLPAGKGAWAIDQNFKTSIGGSYLLGYIRVIVLSDGKVFHRKSFDSGLPATPWCQDKLTAAEMREIRSAVAKAKPGAWQARYGDWINLAAPFRRLVFTTLDAKGEVINYTTFVYREYENIALPGERLTDDQVDRCAMLFSWLHKQSSGVSLSVAGNAKGSGLAYHSLFGKGHPGCPGSPVIAQLNDILELASAAYW